MGNHSDDGLDLDRSIFRDSCRTGTGLVVNGAAFRILGRCSQCNGSLYSEMERCGLCVDCQIADCRNHHPLARNTECGWIALSKHETKYMELVEGERLGLRTCSFCRSTISRPVAQTEAA